MEWQGKEKEGIRDNLSLHVFCPLPSRNAGNMVRVNSETVVIRVYRIRTIYGMRLCDD